MRKIKINKTKLLEKEFGGKWKYDNHATWWCDDNKRHVARVQSCHCDDICNHPSVYYMYGDGTPKLIWFWKMV
jgi:hypothetical protein